MAVDVILGLQWGDEGKGKIVDFLAEDYDVVARFQGGPNAGHTLKIDGNTFVLHTIPSGIFREDLINLIGNGVVIDPITLKKEIEKLTAIGSGFLKRLYVANKAHLILPTHRYLDAASEAFKGKQKIGSTLKGIGPTYMDKTGRNGLRVGDIFLSSFQDRYQQLKDKHLRLLKMYPDVDFDLEKEEAAWFESLNTLRQLNRVDGEYFINEMLRNGKRILAEGAQGSMLDIDFGTYPFVTSSNTVTSGVCNGLGIAPSQIGEVIGITKAYCTRVGSGPFPTELEDETGERLRAAGSEFGATTGRPRRCGWIDIPQLLYTIMLNGVTQLALTKIDVLDEFEEIKLCTSYRYEGQESQQLPFDICGIEINPSYESHEGWKRDMTSMSEYSDLPKEARDYIEVLESKLKVPVTMVSVGPGRKQLILRDVNATV